MTRKWHTACYEMKYNVVGKVSFLDDGNNFRLAMTYYIKWMIEIFSPLSERALCIKNLNQVYLKVHVLGTLLPSVIIIISKLKISYLCIFYLHFRSLFEAIGIDKIQI